MQQAVVMVDRWDALEMRGDRCPSEDRPQVEEELQGSEDFPRVLVAGEHIWRGAAVLEGDVAAETGRVLVEYLRCGRTEWVEVARLAAWDPDRRDTPHGLPDPEGPAANRGGATTRVTRSTEESEWTGIVGGAPSAVKRAVGTGVIVLVLDYTEDDEWGPIWGVVKPRGLDDYPYVPITQTDLVWEQAEPSGELGRHAAARWAGESLGLCAPAELWHVLHPEQTGSAFEGEEVIVLLLPQHPELREELTATCDLFECESELPADLARRVDYLTEVEAEEEEDGGSRCASGNRGGAWPKGKSKAKGGAKAKP